MTLAVLDDGERSQEFPHSECKVAARLTKDNFVHRHRIRLHAQKSLGSFGRPAEW
jgi:hypothetical protein